MESRGTRAKIKPLAGQTGAFEGCHLDIEGIGRQSSRPHQKISETFVRFHGNERRGAKLKQSSSRESSTRADLEGSRPRSEVTALLKDFKDLFRVTGSGIMVAVRVGAKGSRPGVQCVAGR